MSNRKFNLITTPALRAPEIFLAGPWNEKTDIWAFGCLVSPVYTIPPFPSFSSTAALQIFELINN